DRPHVAVMLNAKGGRWFTGLYDRDDGGWRRRGEAQLLTIDQVLAHGPRPLAIIADVQPDVADDVTVLDRALARPRSEVVWRLGRELAAAGRYVDAYELTPRYVRLPDAEEKRQRQSGVST
ncbi:MAG: hypothetical protein KGY81_06795, partial [Phycisphaerae bacterium]|nr:hypothetical protein [Phycisphaerae bacterium]